MEGGKLERCLDSLQMQTYTDAEFIIVDDGSKDGTQEFLLERASHDSRIRNIGMAHQGRVFARNAGMAVARGEWFCWLDSDDAYDQMYLATLAYNIEKEPDVRLWVLGVVMHGIHKENGKHTVPRWTKLRKAWMPPVDANGVHAHFTSGKIGTGMFVFHRECYEKIGPLPPWKNHNFVADGVDEWLGYETGYGSDKKLVGNPWGDDWAYFRKLTMHYRVHLIDACLYIHYVR
jgi:glycosyltransferase involved in cell wall biosynthesis